MKARRTLMLGLLVVGHFTFSRLMEQITADLAESAEERPLFTPPGVVFDHLVGSDWMFGEIFGRCGGILDEAGGLQTTCYEIKRMEKG